MFKSLLITVGVSALLADSYHVVDIRDLSFEDEAGIVEGITENMVNLAGVGNDQFMKFPSFRVAEGIEIYWGRVDEKGEAANWGPQGDLRVAFCLKDGQQVSGFLDEASSGSSLRTAFAFSLDVQKNKPSDKAAFDAVKKAHYRRLSSHLLPGTAWFRHQTGKHNAAINGRRQQEGGFEQSFALMSGGRAISENLALDRELILGIKEKGKGTAIADIRGVTVAPIDWKDRLPKEKVSIDPLAHYVPHDQHVLFSPSVSELFGLLDLVEKEGAPVIQAFSVRNPFRTLPTRYRQQMGLDLPKTGSQFLPIKSVAITGGDPFFPSGTDVAVLFETDQPEVIYNLLASVTAAKAKQQKAKPQELEVDGVEQYQGFETKNRLFSSYVMRAGGIVVVSNSRVQLKALLAVQAKKVQALGATEEYAFFRHRYPLANKESAFLYLSDATIRRWASPRVRIAASRRVRAAAALSELTSQSISKKPVSDDYQPLLGRVSVSGDSVLSDNYGTLHFVTPVSELQLDTATVAEVKAYDRWRRGYEQGWSQAFDPIALKINLSKGERKIELSVLPLTVDSDYREWIEIAGKSKLSGKAVTPHPEALFFGSFAIDTENGKFSEFDTSISQMIPGLKVKPLSWVGESISLFTDKGLFWKAALESENFESFLSSNYAKIPVGIRIESKSSLKLTLFISALKAMVESSAPDLVRWGIRKHNDKSYVAVIGNEDADEFTLYYAALPSAWLLALNEDVLKRAIDREIVKGQKTPKDSPKQALVSTSPQFLQLVSGGAVSSFEQRRQKESWRALPILNAWHRKFPKEDPASAHLLRFASEVVCPGGKGYQWNAKDMTMESVAYGHPAAAREEGVEVDLLKAFQQFDAGIDFEDDGLRLRASLRNSPEINSVFAEYQEWCIPFEILIQKNLWNLIH